MRLSTLTYMGFELNAALDAGKTIEVEELKRTIIDGDVFSLLKERLGAEIDFTMLDDDDCRVLREHWANLARVMDESRKMGVNRNGLCLLIGYLLEPFQHPPAELKPGWGIAPIRQPA